MERLLKGYEKKIGLCLNELIEKGNWNSEAQYQLFSVTDPEKLWSSRLGYYYGYELAKSIGEKIGIEKLFINGYENVLQEIKLYFSLNSIS